MKKYIPLLLVLTLVFSACTASESALTGTWKLVSYGSPDAMTSAVPDADATLTFAEDGTVGGSSGCNSMSGEYTVDGNQITFGVLTSTLMACDDARMVQESAVFQALSETAQFEIDDNTLTIVNNEMTLVLTSVLAE